MWMWTRKSKTELFVERIAKPINAIKDTIYQFLLSTDMKMELSKTELLLSKREELQFTFLSGKLKTVSNVTNVHMYVHMQ